MNYDTPPASWYEPDDIKDPVEVLCEVCGAHLQEDHVEGDSQSPGTPMTVYRCPDPECEAHADDGFWLGVNEFDALVNS